MESKRRMDELLARVDEVQLFELAEGVNAVGVFEYMAPSDASASALQEAITALKNVEAVEIRAGGVLEVWLVAAFVGSPGCSESDRRAFLEWMKQVAPAHRCRFLGWGVYDRRDIIDPSRRTKPNELRCPTDGPSSRSERRLPPTGQPNRGT